MVITNFEYTNKEWVISIQKRIRFRREELNMTQNDVAERLKISRSKYSFYENKADKLPFLFIRGTASILNTTCDKLIYSPFEIVEKQPLFDKFPVTEREKKFLIKYRILPLNRKKQMRDFFEEIYKQELEISESKINQ